MREDGGLAMWTSPFDVPGSNVVEQVVYVPPRAVGAGKGQGRVGRQVELSRAATEAAARAELAAGPAGRVYINRNQYFEVDPLTCILWSSSPQIQYIGGRH